ncbi:tetratricopeptide repeat protein [Listeria costaricensis]|uniref:tetratricopeptide repeat protein n=1 Tax=Listeria costaricensis TaxID=2026604 RepID=UPI000C07EAF6|nr:hypothetical protein [Listeria costaricensis]
MKIASYERTIHLIENGHLETAKNEAENMILENPSHFAGYLNLSYYYLKINQLENAAQQMEQVIVYHTGQKEIYQQAIAIYKGLKDARKVINYARAGIKLFPEEAIFYFELAEHLPRRLNEREPFYQKAIELQPENAHFLAKYSYLLALKEPKNKQALHYEHLALGLEPEEPLYLFWFAKVNYRRGDFERARSLSEQAVSLAPDNEQYQLFNRKMQQTKQPIWALYEKTRLFFRFTPLYYTIPLITAYLWGVYLLGKVIGSSALFLLAIPLLLMIAAILIQIKQSDHKLTAQERQNRYVRLPIAIISLVFLMGIYFVSSFQSEQNSVPLETQPKIVGQQLPSASVEMHDKMGH